MTENFVACEYSRPRMPPVAIAIAGLSKPVMLLGTMLKRRILHCEGGGGKTTTISLHACDNDNVG